MLTIFLITIFIILTLVCVVVALILKTIPSCHVSSLKSRAQDQSNELLLFSGVQIQGSRSEGKRKWDGGGGRAETSVIYLTGQHLASSTTYWLTSRTDSLYRVWMFTPIGCWFHASGERRLQVSRLSGWAGKAWEEQACGAGSRRWGVVGLCLLKTKSRLPQQKLAAVGQNPQ